MYSRALPHSLILRIFWAATSIISIIKLHTSTRMFQSNTMQPFNYYVSVFVFIAATCIAILGMYSRTVSIHNQNPAFILIHAMLGLLFVKSHQSFDRYTALPANSVSKDSFFSSVMEVQPLFATEILHSLTPCVSSCATLNTSAP
jgi:hypothetical protein